MNAVSIVPCGILSQIKGYKEKERYVNDKSLIKNVQEAIKLAKEKDMSIFCRDQIKSYDGRIFLGLELDDSRNVLGTR